MENVNGNLMATNTSNRSLTNWLVVPVSRCIPWFAVLVTESLAIITLNIITIAVFVKQRQRQRQSTYLIIHLAVVDLMIGAVNGPVRAYEIGSFCDLWGHDLRDANRLPGLEYVSMHFVHLVSILNLVVISSERVHATFRSFNHCFIKKWVYAVMTILIWLMPVTIFPIIESIPVHDLSTRARRNLVYFFILSYLSFLYIYLLFFYLL